jgi:hypothetical protein
MFFSAAGGTDAIITDIELESPGNQSEARELASAALITKKPLNHWGAIPVARCYESKNLCFAAGA